MPGEDLHLSDIACSQAHIPPASAAWSFSFGLFRSKEKPGGLNLKLHAAEADGVSMSFHTASVATGSSTQLLKKLIGWCFDRR